MSGIDFNGSYDPEPTTDDGPTNAEVWAARRAVDRTRSRRYWKVAAALAAVVAVISVVATWEITRAGNGLLILLIAGLIYLPYAMTLRAKRAAKVAADTGRFYLDQRRGGPR